MKKNNGELRCRDHILLFLIAAMTFILPALFFQPRKIMPSPKPYRKTPVILANAETYQSHELEEQLYYFDPKVFLEGDDAHSFARFRVREYNPEVLLKQIGGMPPLLEQKTPDVPVGRLPGSDRQVFSAPLFQPMSLKSEMARDRKSHAYPLLFNTDGRPLPDCRIPVNSNAVMPGQPTKLQINVSHLDIMPGLVHVELLASCGNIRFDMLAQRAVNQYLLANPGLSWQNGGVLTVYWAQNVKPAAFPAEEPEKGDRS